MPTWPSVRTNIRTSASSAQLSLRSISADCLFYFWEGKSASGPMSADPGRECICPDWSQPVGTLWWKMWQLTTSVIEHSQYCRWKQQFLINASPAVDVKSHWLNQQFSANLFRSLILCEMKKHLFDIENLRKSGWMDFLRGLPLMFQCFYQSINQSMICMYTFRTSV